MSNAYSSSTKPTRRDTARSAQDRPSHLKILPVHQHKSHLVTDNQGQPMTASQSYINPALAVRDPLDERKSKASPRLIHTTLKPVTLQNPPEKRRQGQPLDQSAQRYRLQQYETHQVRDSRVSPRPMSTTVRLDSPTKGLQSEEGVFETAEKHRNVAYAVTTADARRFPSPPES